jgi:hypothetical protein
MASLARRDVRLLRRLWQTSSRSLSSTHASDDRAVAGFRKNPALIDGREWSKSFFVHKPSVGSRVVPDKDEDEPCSSQQSRACSHHGSILFRDRAKQERFLQGHLR